MDKVAGKDVRIGEQPQIPGRQAQLLELPKNDKPLEPIRKRKTASNARLSTVVSVTWTDSSEKAIYETKLEYWKELHNRAGVPLTQDIY